jgi:FimV-like protein
MNFDYQIYTWTDFFKMDAIAQYLLLAIVTLLIIFILLPRTKRKKISNDRFHLKDINIIAGEDVLATQLDLAKAYLEMDQKKLAKKALKRVAKKGTLSQQKEARNLMKAL